MHSAFEHNPMKEEHIRVKKQIFMCAFGCHLTNEPRNHAVIHAFVSMSLNYCKSTASCFEALQ